VKLKIPSLTGCLSRGPPILALAAVGLVLAMAVPVQALSVLVSPGADLPAGRTRIHPDGTLGLSGTYEFNVFTGSGLTGWTLADTLTTDFSNEKVAGTFYSEVYTHSEGHTLFTYQIYNSGTTDIRHGNLAGFASGWEFLDSGVLHFGAVSDDYIDGDVLALGRPANGEQLNFAFEGWNGSGMTEMLLETGQTSTWFYAVTDAPSWHVGRATVQDSGSSASPVAVLVPAPEPVTLAGLVLGVGCLGRYVRKRSRM